MLSGIPSPTALNVKGPPNNSPPLAWQPLALFLITCTGLDSEKHPCMLLALSPIPTPVTSPLKAKCHIRQTPAPGVSKLTALGIGGIPRIYPSLSVTSHAKLSPTWPSTVIAPVGILSGIPSPTASKVKGPPVRVPPTALHPVVVAAVLVTCIELTDKLKQPSRPLILLPTAKPTISSTNAT